MSTSLLDRSSAPPESTRRRIGARADVCQRWFRSRLVAVGERLNRPDPDTSQLTPYRPGDKRLRRELMRPAVLGFVASVSIVLGASQQNSPFTLKQVGAWFFGVPALSSSAGAAPPGQGLFLGVVAVYGGMLLMLRAWYDVVRFTRRYRGTPVRTLVPVFCAWVVPLLFVAPLFSRDAYSYAAQGELMSHGFSPYQYDPQLLNGSLFYSLTDHLWANVPSPYGPLFLMIDSGIVSLTGHNALASVEGLRFLALGGTVLFAAGIPVIARSFGRDGASAFALAALNPLILLHLVGGEHNDALMLGLFVVGYAFARRGHPLFGVFCCALAASVKAPAILGAVYIGWEWLGPGRSPRERLRPVVTALLFAGAVMAALSLIARIGWGWVSGLSNPDTVRSWLDPATAIGLFAGRLASVIGLGGQAHLLLTLARGSGLLLAAAIALWMLWRSDEIGPLRALGWSLLAIVVLSPVIQPWYLTWGIVFLAPVAERGVRRVVIGLSAVSCFLGLPGGLVLIHELGIANPWLVALASGILVAIATVILFPRLRARTATPTPEQLETVHASVP